MRELVYRKGLTLLETMIALLFIGIIAGCSNPTGTKPSSSNATVRRFEVVTKQWEAKKILQEIYVRERAYREKNDSYWPPNGIVTAIASNSEGIKPLGIRIPPYARYTYNIIGGYSTFSAVASCGTLDDDRTQDIWGIDDTGNLRVISDDAAD